MNLFLNFRFASSGSCSAIALNDAKLNSANLEHLVVNGSAALTMALLYAVRVAMACSVSFTNSSYDGSCMPVLAASTSQTMSRRLATKSFMELVRRCS